MVVDPCRRWLEAKVLAAARSGPAAVRRGRRDTSLRARIVGVVDEAAVSLGFAPALHLTGLIDTDVDDDIAEHLLAVLTEALSNVARHADASAADVSVV